MNRLPLPALFCLCLFFFLSLSAERKARRFRVMEYNVENLFDTCHHEGHDDLEFLPGSERQWNTYRYWKKLGQLSRIITAAGGAEPVDLVGLCEVENDSVLHHLTQRTRLARLGYKYIVTHGNDVCGLNVALLYQPETFLPLSSDTLRIPLHRENERPTRDMLHVCGLIATGDTLDVFVCHLPSRRGSSPVSRELRCRATACLRHAADSILACRQTPSLLLLGDFNDEYNDASLAVSFGAVPPSSKSHRQRPDTAAFHILSARLSAPNGIKGTYKFREKWNQLDQMIVNKELLSEERTFFIPSPTCRIFDFPDLLEPDPVQGGVKPRRTYLGPVYKGGPSDHLPLLLDFVR